MQWIKLTDRMPNPDEHGRVLIYTEGYDFNGEQVFDVKAETLNENFYADPDDQPEVCRVATHWIPHPASEGAAASTTMTERMNTEQERAALTAQSEYEHSRPEVND